MEASSIFKIDASLHYIDDPTESKFEILKSDLDGQTYLVFELLLAKTSLAARESDMFSAVWVGLQLDPDHGPNSIFKLSKPVSIVLLVIVSAAYLVLVQSFLLPKPVSDLLFCRSGNEK